MSVPDLGATARRLEAAGVALAIARHRGELVDQLSGWVTRAVDEHRQPGDPPGRWDPSWLHDLPPWQAGRFLAPIDRLRQAHDDLLTLEVQSWVICSELAEAKVDPLAAVDRLGRLTDRRAPLFASLRLAERAVRPAVTPEVAAGLRHTVGLLVESEERAVAARHWLTEGLETPLPTPLPTAG